MRHLILLRGLPGSGKSTFLEKNKLDHFSISSDNVRLMLRSPEYNKDGFPKVSSRVNQKVKKLILSLTEERMENGDLTIIDATHLKKEDIKKFFPLVSKYRYELSVIEFPFSLKQSLVYNQKRPVYKRLTDEKIKSMAETKEDLPKGVKKYKPQDFLNKIKMNPLNLNKYKKIVHFGDIQGCFSPLKKYFKANKISQDTLYIFVGDYLDRGKENDKVLKFVLKHLNKDNFVFLEGNHEEYLWKWSIGVDFFKYDFEKTKKQIEGFSKRNIRNFCKNLHLFYYYTFHGKEILVSHAGMGFFPKQEDFIKISASQFIKGIGQEGDIDNYFAENNKRKYLIHGHKNRDNTPIVNKTSFNLEGKIDAGGSLRVLELTKEGFTPLCID